MATAQFNLKDFQIVTFDVWNTLIVANPEFSRLRTEEIAAAYGITFEEAKEAYTSVKHFLDQSAEIASVCMSTQQCWLLLNTTIQRLRRKQGLDHIPVDVFGLSARCNELFRQNLPKFTAETKAVLRGLKEAGKVVGIISNTNFIPGGLLWEELFMDLDIFAEPFFSDQALLPKPHKHVFSQVRVNMVEAYWETVNVNVTASSLKCLHVGDNLVCDGGAIKDGYSFQHVDNPDNLVEIFKEMGI
ncbi:hypothetical protein D3C75_501600 [compost metagenome]